MKALSYNQIKMIFTYFWDYPVQLYPQVDLVISHKLSSGQIHLHLDEELSDPNFWDLYVSVDSNVTTLIDLFRICQKMSQYCGATGNKYRLQTTDDLLMLFSKLNQFTKKARSLFLQDNQMMITREMFEGNIEQLLLRFRVRERDMKLQVEKGGQEQKLSIEFSPNYCSEAHEIDELTKIELGNSGGKQFYIESSDYQVRYQLNGDGSQMISLTQGTRISIGISQFVVLENLSFQEIYYHQQIINIPPSRKLISVNKLIQSSMIPKVKLLFLTGPLKGQKFLLEPSLANSDTLNQQSKQDFFISSASQADICLPNLDSTRAVISFRPTYGWVFQVISAPTMMSNAQQTVTPIYWLLRSQGMNKELPVRHELRSGKYVSMEGEFKIRLHNN